MKSFWIELHRREQATNYFQYSLLGGDLLCGPVNCSVGVCRLYTVSKLHQLNSFLNCRSIFRQTCHNPDGNQSINNLTLSSSCFPTVPGTFHWLESGLIVALGSLECPPSTRNSRNAASQLSVSLLSILQNPAWKQIDCSVYLLSVTMGFGHHYAVSLRICSEMMVWWMQFLTCIFLTCIFLRICETLISTWFDL